MMDQPGTPAAGPQPDITLPPEFEPITNGWFSAAQIMLIVAGVGYLLIGLASMALFSSGIDEELGDAGGLFMGIFMLVFAGGFGALNFLAVWGLKRRAKWAWVVALVLGAMYTPSVCLPVGIVILVGLLHDDVRKPFWA